MREDWLRGKTMLITGGTGSFGVAALDRYLGTALREIRVFSRDEKKQDALRRAYQQKHPRESVKLRFYIGDVRNPQSLWPAMAGVDYVFHAAALKQVPSCEFFPMEAVLSNVIGADNVITAAMTAGVSRVVCLSTDKAAYPVNVMGATKLLMERLAIARSQEAQRQGTVVCCTRYGNVLCSRGSVVPLFMERMREGLPLAVTDPAMTRFIMTLQEAVALVDTAMTIGGAGDILVQKAPACSLGVLSQAVKEIFSYGAEDRIIGIRHGEKLHETLMTNEEAARAVEADTYFRIVADARDMNYTLYATEGNPGRRALPEFNSANTRQLTLEEVKSRLLSLPEIRAERRKAAAR